MEKVAASEVMGTTFKRSILVRVSRSLLVRFNDQWFNYDCWADLLEDIDSTDRLRVQPVFQRGIVR